MYYSSWVVSFICILYLGQNGNDRRFWSIFASSTGIWYRHFCWGDWNQGKYVNPRLEEYKGSASYLSFNTFFKVSIIFFLWIYTLQRSVASTGKRTTIQFSDLKRKRYWFPLMVEWFVLKFWFRFYHIVLWIFGVVQA